MSSGAELDIETARREVREATALLESARNRMVHAQALAPLPREGVLAAGGMITAIGLLDCVTERLMGLPTNPGLSRAAHSAGSGTSAEA